MLYFTPYLQIVLLPCLALGANSTSPTSSNITDEIKMELNQLLAPISSQLETIVQGHLQFNIGKHECNPARSCKEIKETVPNSASGYYYLKTTLNTLELVYCDMDRICGGVGGGWMRVAQLDMGNTSQSCPSGLVLNEIYRRRCIMPSDEGGCASHMYRVHGVTYQRVCGKVIGYQYGSPDAFANEVGHYSINGAYVDGVSLTHGQRTSRHHIWTFACAVDESETHGQSIYVCPCTSQALSQAQIPSFVGSDYFCDSGSRNIWAYQLYPYDPLWDGDGCGSTSTCCSFNNPPWFMKTLSSRSTDDLELRVCRDEARDNENIGLREVELYVQ